MNILYFDMDGVLTDLEGYMSSQFFEGLPLDDIPSEVRRQAIEDHTLRNDMFFRLPPNPNIENFLEIMDHVQKNPDWDVHILTSCGSVSLEPKYVETVRLQKEQWIAEWIPDDLVSSMKLVVDCNEKSLYAGSDKYLIDDKESNCNQFMHCGGTSFLYDMNRHDDSIIPIIHTLRTVSALPAPKKVS